MRREFSIVALLLRQEILFGGDEIHVHEKPPITI